MSDAGVEYGVEHATLGGQLCREDVMHIRDAIKTVVAGRDLEQEDAAGVMEAIMSGEATPAQIAAFLTALHLKGETDAEIAGMELVMREKAVPVIHDLPVL